MRSSLHRSLTVSAAVVLASLAAACDSDLSTKADSAKTSTTAKRDDATSTTDGSDMADTTSEGKTAEDNTDDVPEGFRELSTPFVAVIDAGTDPQLRTFEFREGDTSTTTETTEMHMEQTLDGGSVTIDYTTTGHTKYDVVSVEDEIATIRQVVVSTEVAVDDSVPPQVAASIAQSTKSMDGLTLNLQVDSRGNILNVTPDPSTLPDSDAMASQMLDTLINGLGASSQPWPDKPVGVGAHWTQRSDVTLAGVRTVADADVKLLSIEGGVAKVEATTKIEQTAPTGSAVEVDGSGTGTTTRSITLGSYLGQSVHTESTTDTKTATPMAEQQITLEIRGDTKPEQ